MDISAYEGWVSGIRTAARGMQRWGGRVRIYEAVRANPTSLTRSVADFCSETQTPQSTFYAYFGKSPTGSRWPFFADSADVVAPAIAETRAWAMYPYLRGAVDESKRLQAGAIAILESIARAAAEWATADPTLALVRSDVPLWPLVDTLRTNSGLTTPESSAGHWEDIARDLVVYSAEAPGESSLAVLNTVRPRLLAQIERAAAISETSAAANAVDAVAHFVELVLERGGLDDLDREAKIVLEQALATLRDHQ